jgi:hypothetical protein
MAPMHNSVETRQRGPVRRRWAANVVMAAAAAICVASLTGAGSAVSGTHAARARANASGGTWGTAEEVPGLAALNAGDNAQINSVSCASPGNCSAGGFYTDMSGDQQAFVVGESGGTWGTAEEVATDLNTFSAAILSVSCTSAGNCSAGGYYYQESPSEYEPFVISEANGTWGAALEVAAPINTGGFPQVSSVSCASAGNCSAAGEYDAAPGIQEAFVVGETNGTWGASAEVPGIGSLNKGESAEVNSVSCASAGNCGIGGYYTGTSGLVEAFVAGETSGTWGKAKEVPGTGSLNSGGDAEATSVSCASAGNCSAGGFYKSSSAGWQAFTVGETSGTWGKAKEVPGTGSLNTGGDAEISSLLPAPGPSAVGTPLSCAAAGDCSVGGYYTSSSGDTVLPFVAGETNGTWGKAKHVPGLATLGGNAEILAVSCASAGHCGAGGYYDEASTSSTRQAEAFVVSET